MPVPGCGIFASPLVPSLQQTAQTRPGWRERAANLAANVAFAIYYTVCARCGLGWVEQPYTMEKYHRCGLVTAGLEALRLEHLDVSWHTLGGHFQDSPGRVDGAGMGTLGCAGLC
ncbi:hypothetical protein AB0G54_41445 [Streptomyces yokosukanensis]|uniref:hypothetical protein n=1 Tax=Streptomyces yokosukanensis TaxID=67386 RepID=UPI000ACB0CC7|nr:hypothetical protein [Streptomyces yokosukanensis]